MTYDAQDRIQHREQWDRMERAEADAEVLTAAARLAHSALQRMCECIPAYVASGSNLHFDCIAARDQLQAALEKTGEA